MENEHINKQNEILSKAKESIYNFQKQFNNYMDMKHSKSPTKNNTNDEIMTFNPKKNFKNNKDLFIINETKEENIKIHDKIFSSPQKYINNNVDDENIIENANDNYFNQKNNEKMLNNIIEENMVLKSEINRLIDENKNLDKELNKNKKSKEKEENIIMKNKEGEIVLKRNKELSKLIKELNNRNRIQKQRNQDIEQILKEKNNYISQIESKIKEINSNNEKNNLYKTKYNQLLARFDIINKELNLLKKNKTNNEELISENKKLKEDLNNLLKKKDLSDNNNIKANNLICKTENNEPKKKSKKEKEIINIKTNKKDDDEKVKQLNKIISELKFENNSLKDICSELQNKNKELKGEIGNLQNINEENKNQYLIDIDKLQKDIIEFKQKELKEKKELENKLKSLSNNKEIIDLRNKVKELLQYKNKCSILEENKYQLKNEIRKYKQEIEKEKETSSIIKEISNDKQKNELGISNQQSLIFESKNNSLVKSEISIEKDKIEVNEAYIELNKRIGELMKKNEDLSRENNKLENKKNELIQNVNNLNDLVDLNNKDLVNKILELQKIIEVLNKELNLENDKKIVLENKILNLEKKINRQIDEVSEREEMSIRKESQKESMENNNETKAFNINEESDEKIESYKIQILSLKNENYSLMKTINNLKNEIRIYKIKLNSSKKVKDGKDKNSIKDDEDLIKNILEEMNRWKKGYYNLSKLNDIYKEKLSKLESGIGIEEEVKYLKEVLYQKDKLLMDLTLQIKEYQSESDDIILGKSNKKLEKQIDILLKEVKGIRKRMLNIVTFNDRINNFEEFINNIEIIQKLENQIKNKEAKKACGQLKLFIDEYKLNNEMAFNEFLVKLYSI